jgi:HEAT repeat protein
MLRDGRTQVSSEHSISGDTAAGGAPSGGDGAGRSGPPERGTPARRAPADAALAFEDWDEAPVPDADLNDVFHSLEKATRARRLYQENNPVLQGFLASTRAAFAKLWDRLPSLTVSVEELSFKCFGREYASKEGRDGLPFLFFRDGVRVLTFLPGFEEELDLFLHVIDRSRQMGPRASDDIVTLMWEEEFSAFQYSYVDLLAAGETMPHAPAQPTAEPVDRALIEQSVAGEDEEAVPPAVAAGEPPIAQIVSMDQFVETTYFLESHEVENLYREVDAEWQRDVRGDVLNALFDRLEDETVDDRHGEIIRILGQLLPAFLARGDLKNTTKILTEVARLVEDPDLGESERADIDRLLKELAEPQVLSQFLGSLEDGTVNPTDEELATFLSYLGAESMPMLIRTVEKTESSRLRERLGPALDGVGHKHGRALALLVAAPDELVAWGAARIAGRVRLRAATNNLIALLRREQVDGRRIAAEALAALADPSAVDALQEALADNDREVRIAAARGLSATRTPDARDRLRAMVKGRAMRDADLTEQMAVFEAFGSVAQPEDVELLDKLLNGRKLLGKASAEVRSCAALALGRMTVPEARASLLSAAQDQNPMVRNAVSKALAKPRA